MPRIIKHLKDLRCCDGDAITLECNVEGTPEPNVFWEKDGKILHDKSVDHRQQFDGRRATLSIPRVFPEDEGQYCLVACNSMGRVKSLACIIVDGNFFCNFLCTGFNIIKFCSEYSARGKGKSSQSSTFTADVFIAKLNTSLNSTIDASS